MSNHPAPAAECPYCASLDVEMMSLFGQQLMTVQYYCNACRTPFERVKGRDVMLDAWGHARHGEHEGLSPSPAGDGWPSGDSQ